MSGRSFRYSFNSDSNYSVTATATGYSDLQDIIRLSAKPITIEISPESGNTQTQFTITTDANATIFINGDEKGESYTGTLTSGLNTIEAFKTGYLDSKKNLTIDSSIIFSHTGEFKKGVVQTITLNKNVSWQVYYQKDIESELTLLSEGTGNVIDIEPDKSGIWIVKAESSQQTYTIESNSIFGFITKDWWVFPGYVWLIAALAIAGFFKFKKPKQDSDVVGFGGSSPKDFSAKVNY